MSNGFLSQLITVTQFQDHYMQLKVHSIQIFYTESFCIFIAQLFKSKYLQFKPVPSTEIKILENQ